MRTGETASARLRFVLAPGYHTNSSKPNDEYLIPLRLSWDAAPLVVEGIEYPKGKDEKYAFSDKPVSVYSGSFEVTTRLKAPAGVPLGPRNVPGKLRYQACTTNMCMPPKTLTFQLPVEVR